MKRLKGFTLIEILIVLAIIGILAALLFPVFKRVKENGNQTSCASNLHQIGLAVGLYRNDEKEYPSSLAFLLPNDASIFKGTGTTTVDGQACDTTAATCPNTSGTGWLKSTKGLMCPDDDKDDVLRSSYGDISTVPGTTPDPPYAGDPSDMSRYVWNYYGYDANGVAYATQAQAAAAATATYLVDPGSPYDINHNPIKYSMSNRFAPADTIITHCVFHRTQTSSAADPTVVAPNAKDIIVRVDGAAKVTDVANYGTGGNWQQQNK